MQSIIPNFTIPTKEQFPKMTRKNIRLVYRSLQNLGMVTITNSFMSLKTYQNFHDHLVRIKQIQPNQYFQWGPAPISIQNITNNHIIFQGYNSKGQTLFLTLTNLY